VKPGPLKASGHADALCLDAGGLRWRLPLSRRLGGTGSGPSRESDSAAAWEPLVEGNAAGDEQ